jgi:hypothetical protein
MRKRNITFVVLSSLFVMCGCQQAGDTGTGPGTSPVEPTPQNQPVNTGNQNTANWRADATVVSVATGSTPACGWGTSPGEVRDSVDWRITLTAKAIWLDEDMRNWPTDDIPYSGHLDGAQFAASYTSASNYADFVCQFREASFTGRFTSDSTFDAVETLVWGRPGTETTVIRRWHGSRL